MVTVIGDLNMEENKPDYESCDKEGDILLENHMKKVMAFTAKYRNHKYDDYRNKMQKDMEKKFFEDLRALREKYNVPEPE